MAKLNSGQRATVERILERPTRADIAWRDIELLLKALGCLFKEGRRGRVRVSFGDRDIVFHRPHPRPDTSKGAVDAAREFLVSTGALDPWSTEATPPARSRSTKARKSSRER